MSSGSPMRRGLTCVIAPAGRMRQVSLAAVQLHSCGGRFRVPLRSGRHTPLFPRLAPRSGRLSDSALQRVWQSRGPGFPTPSADCPIHVQRPRRSASFRALPVPLAPPMGFSVALRARAARKKRQCALTLERSDHRSRLHPNARPNRAPAARAGRRDALGHVRERMRTATVRTGSGGCASPAR